MYSTYELVIAFAAMHLSSIVTSRLSPWLAARRRRRVAAASAEWMQRVEREHPEPPRPACGPYRDACPPNLRQG